MTKLRKCADGSLKVYDREIFIGWVWRERGGYYALKTPTGDEDVRGSRDDAIDALKEKAK